MWAKKKKKSRCIHANIRFIGDFCAKCSQTAFLPVSTPLVLLCRSTWIITHYLKWKLVAYFDWVGFVVTWMYFSLLVYHRDMLFWF